MTNKTHNQKRILVYAHWEGIVSPLLIGSLFSTLLRGKEIFSFEYSKTWLESPYSLSIDPNLSLFSGPQYPRNNNENFGIFLDSSPDRWGRVLMQRKEALLAKSENRQEKYLMESDYLLGVFDSHRMGALRFKLLEDGNFLDDNQDMAAPPWSSLRDLEYASLQLENKNSENHTQYSKWLRMLIAPGSSLGGARPKASVTDSNNHPWIAKFPSNRDEINIGKWEYLTYLLAKEAQLDISESKFENFSNRFDTFLTKRFDRTSSGNRLHFASAMTLLGMKDGDGADTGVSYLDLANFIIKYGCDVNRNLEQLWRRIVFYICVSNTDDHLRNHGFILTESGWILSPAYDINPTSKGWGLALNISKSDNSLDLELAKSVAIFFRVPPDKQITIINDVISAVKKWSAFAQHLGIPAPEIQTMKNAFKITEDYSS